MMARRIGEFCCTIAIFLVVLFFSSTMQGTILLTGQQDLNHDNAAWLLSLPGMGQLTAIANDLRTQNRSHLVGSRSSSLNGYYSLFTKPWQSYETTERGIIPQDALMVWGSLGQFYYLPDLAVIDFYGLTDKTVARNPVKHSNRMRKVAHDRRPSHDYLAERSPNFRVFLLEESLDDALNVASYAVEVAPGLWMPFNAVNREWASDRFGKHNFHALAPPLKPLAVTYDRGLALEGFVVWQDKKSSQSPLVLNPTELVFMVARWRIAAGVTEDYSLSVRLHDANGQRVFQHDNLILYPTLIAPYLNTSSWPKNQPADHLFAMQLPADIPPGEYEMRLVVYDFNKGHVTAELDTWSTEIVLTTIRLEND